MMSEKTCPNCGTALAEESLSCPNCGCPLEAQSESQPAPAAPESPAPEPSPCGADPVPEQAAPVAQETAADPQKAKQKKLILLIAAAAIIIIAVIAAVCALRASRAKAMEAYGDQLESVTYTMLSGAADAETACNLIKSVWYNAIFEESDPETDPFTRRDGGTGSFYSDFNTALSLLFIDADFIADIDAIEDNQAEVKEAIQALADPPEQYQSAYDDLMDFYDAYLILTNLACSPSGSLQSYADDFNTADTATLTAYNRMELHFDD